ncbi:hypothetical protein F2Q70_00026383 [Brassica cretica]|uniref:catalase n=1 Tax=Brassica cretica TaxID=69181 RepID=A0A8S9LB17_BRACR|nr:hypothetical protein F2Q70_00026383 [Brassica cretica]
MFVLALNRFVCIIEKENNFKEPGDRYRSFTPERQERFIGRWIDALSDPPITHEIRNIWISYWSQANKSLGQKLASRLNVRPRISKTSEQDSRLVVVWFQQTRRKMGRDPRCAMI